MKLATISCEIVLSEEAASITTFRGQIWRSKANAGHLLCVLHTCQICLIFGSHNTDRHLSSQPTPTVVINTVKLLGTCIQRPGIIRWSHSKVIIDHPSCVGTFQSICNFEAPRWVQTMHAWFHPALEPCLGLRQWPSELGSLGFTS